MKKKYIILISSLALVLVSAAILLIVLLTGNKLGKYTKYLEESTLEAVTITSTTTIKDQDIVVYEYIKEIAKGEKITITETTKQFDSSFEMKEKTEVTELDTLDTSTLLSINLSKDLLSEYEIKKGVLSFELSKEKLLELLNTEEISVSQNAYLEFRFDDKKIQEIMITFKTESGKDASVLIKYGY